jgi:hypothetical protein
MYRTLTVDAPVDSTKDMENHRALAMSPISSARTSQLGVHYQTPTGSDEIVGFKNNVAGC